MLSLCTYMVQEGKYIVIVNPCHFFSFYSYVVTDDSRDGIAVRR